MSLEVISRFKRLLQRDPKSMNLVINENIKGLWNRDPKGMQYTQTSDV